MVSFRKALSIAAAGFCFLIFAQPAAALTVSPVKVEVSGDPGQTLVGEIELFNEQVETKNLFSSVENFEPSGDTGSPKFVGGESGLATWVAVTDRTVVEPSKTVKLPYSITIPADAEPGGYFAAIFFSESNPESEQGGNVSIGGKLGVLILLRVNGDIKEAAGISNFGFDGESRWRTQLPITFVYRFKNDGADRVVPRGDIVIKNTFGSVVTTLPANVNEGSVLPNSIRKFSAQWGVPSAEGASSSFFSIARAQMKDFHFGMYKAELALTYGEANQVALASINFFFVPWQLLLLVLLGIGVVVLLLMLYTRWVIGKSQRQV
jgi:hypothetical protein